MMCTPGTLVKSCTRLYLYAKSVACKYAKSVKHTCEYCAAGGCWRNHRATRECKCGQCKCEQIDSQRRSREVIKKTQSKISRTSGNRHHRSSCIATCISHSCYQAGVG